MKKFTTCNTSDKKKRHILRMLPVLTVAGALSIALTGCGTSSEDEVQRYSWPLATASPEDTVTQIFAEKFAEEVADLSDGKMKIQVYANSTLGGDRDLLETCSDGDIPFVVQNTAPQVSFMSDLAVFDLPCVFDSLDDCRKKIDDPEFYSLISDVYTNGGYHLLGMADQGFRVMSTNKPVNSFADFKGQKIRTMENSYHLAFWKALGANPTPMSFSEVYIGLQQHTIDAQENPYEVIVSGKIYEQQDYVVKTNHLPHLLSMIVNEDFYNRLSDKDKKIVDQAAQNARDYSREQCDKRVSDRLSIIKESGTQEIELSQEVLNEMRNRSSSVYEDIRQQVGDALFDAYTKNMNKGE